MGLFSIENEPCLFLLPGSVASLEIARFRHSGWRFILPVQYAEHTAPPDAFATVSQTKTAQKTVQTAGLG